MKIVCCHTALNLIPPLSGTSGVVFYRVDESESAYHDTLAQVWREKETFINVEHDVVVGEDRLKEIWDCNRPWCTIPYYYLPGTAHQYIVDEGLGVAKFHDSLMRNFPNVFLEAETISFEPILTYPPKHWKVVDFRLMLVLKQYRYFPHIHYPVAGHVKELRST